MGWILLVSVLLGGDAVEGEDKRPDFDKLWNYQDPAATEKKFRALRAEVADEDLDYRLQLDTQIARTLGLQRKFAEAHAALDAVQEKLTDDTATARVRYLLERGRTHNTSGAPQKARPLFEKAWELGKQHKLAFHAVDAAHMLAIVAPKDGKLRWNIAAIEHAEQCDDERAKGWLGALYNNIGWDFSEAGEYEKALDYHRRCLAWHRARNEKAERETSRGERIARWSVAKQLRLLKRAEEALAIQRELLAFYDEAGEPDGFVYEEMGECLLLLDKPAEAKPYFAKAHPLLAKMAWLRESEPDRLARLARLADG